MINGCLADICLYSRISTDTLHIDLKPDTYAASVSRPTSRNARCRLPQKYIAKTQMSTNKMHRKPDSARRYTMQLVHQILFMAI